MFVFKFLIQPGLEEIRIFLMCTLFIKLEGARASTGLCVDVSSGVMI